MQRLARMQTCAALQLSSRTLDLCSVRSSRATNSCFSQKSSGTPLFSFFFFLNNTAPPEFSPFPLPAALPLLAGRARQGRGGPPAPAGTPLVPPVRPRPGRGGQAGSRRRRTALVCRPCLLGPRREGAQQ